MFQGLILTLISPLGPVAPSSQPPATMRNTLTSLCAIALAIILPLAIAVLVAEDSTVKTETASEQFRTEKSKRMADPFGHPDLFFAYHADIRTAEGADPYPMNYRFEAFNRAMQARKTAGTKLDWKERGPGNVEGRTRTIIVDPDDPTHNTWLVGSVGGGVWKTVDGGDSWTSLTDHLPNLSVSHLVMAPSNHDIIYMGTGEGFGNADAVAGSGIFKSTDRGESWTQLASTVADNAFRYVNRLAIDPDNPDVVVAATNIGIYRTENGGGTWQATYGSTIPGPQGAGRMQDLRARPDDFDIQFATEYGRKVIKSVDGGKTWQTSLAAFHNGVRRIELAIAPSAPDVVYASLENKVQDENGIYQSDLYRTTDSGETWTAMIEEGESTNMLGGQGWYDNAIAVHPFSPDTVYMGGLVLYKSVPTGESGTLSFPSGFDQSETEDLILFINFGASYFEGILETGDSQSDVLGVTEEDFVSVEIRFGPGLSQKAHRFSVSPTGGSRDDGGPGIARADYMYEDYVDVPFEVWDIDNNRQLMVSFRDQADDGAFNLTPRFTDPGPRDGQSREYLLIHSYDYNDASPQAEISQDGGVVHEMIYFMWPVLAANATWDPAALPEATLRITYSTLTGDFHEIEEFLGGDVVHVDHHNLTMIPINAATNEFKIFNTNDGGPYSSEDGGRSWSGVGYGYNTSQFYGVDKRSGVSQYIGGTQDNGTWRSFGNPTAERGWLAALPGDGFDAVWHPVDRFKMIGSIQYNNIWRTTDGGVSWAPDGVEMTDQGNTGGPFITSIGHSKADPDRVYTIGQSGVWRSDDFAASWTLVPIPAEQWGWHIISGKVRVSIANPKVVWAGFRMTNSGTLHVSRDRGYTFEPVVVPDIAPTNIISGLATHPHDGDTGYVLYSVFRQPKILRTTDFGQTWEDLSGFADVPYGAPSSNGFPDVAVYDLLVMPHNTDILWAGTEVGLFVSNDGGQSWEYSDNGLPAVAIWRMLIVDEEIVLATHGRGIWTLDMSGPVATEDNTSDLPDAIRLEPNYPNPFNPATTLTFAIPAESKVTLKVYDITGRQVATVTDQTYQAGKHQLNWDASSLASGTYFARLQAGSEVRTQRMMLIK